MSSKEQAQILREIAVDVLNFEGQQDVEEKLACGDVQGAAVYLLGALDRLVHDQQIDEETARRRYAALNIDPDKVARIRQRNQLL